jgi:hypothetical protein
VRLPWRTVGTDVLRKSRDVILRDMRIRGTCVAGYQHSELRPLLFTTAVVMFRIPLHHDAGIVQMSSCLSVDQE